MKVPRLQTTESPAFRYFRSRYAAKLLDQKKKVLASLNFLPDLDETKVRYLLREQREVLSGETAEDFLSGIFNKKLASVLLKAAKIQTDKKAGLLTSEELERLGATIREFKIPVKETNSFEQAQICTGGVDTAEIEAETMPTVNYIRRRFHLHPGAGTSGCHDPGI